MDETNSTNVDSNNIGLCVCVLTQNEKEMIVNPADSFEITVGDINELPLEVKATSVYDKNEFEAIKSAAKAKQKAQEDAMKEAKEHEGADDLDSKVEDTNPEKSGQEK